VEMVARSLVYVDWCMPIWRNDDKCFPIAKEDKVDLGPSVEAVVGMQKRDV